MRKREVLIQLLLVFVLSMMLWQGGEAKSPPGFGWPFNSPNTLPITSAFDLDRSSGNRADWMGWKSGDPTAGYGHAYDQHSGTDNGMVNGTNLYAIADGTVTALYEDYPRNDHSGGGNYIIFSHNAAGDTWKVNFWHLDYQGAIPSVSDSVSKGELVAHSNNTGNSTGPHLHYGIQKTSGSGEYSCPYYHGWWENCEFYYGDTRPCLICIDVDADPTLNCRAGTSTSYDIITSLPNDARYVCSQRNAWYRIFLPIPASWAIESRTSGGGVSGSPDYSESGSWANDSAKSTVSDSADDANRVVLVGSGSRYSVSDTPGSDMVTFVPNFPQLGDYEIFTTWCSSANAKNVSCVINHSGGSNTVFVNQRGVFGASGSGTKSDPFVIRSSPYVHSHTTVGGESDWDYYSPCAPSVNETGPEILYFFETYKTTDVTVSVDHSGYPGLDVDIQLLGSKSENDCLNRADWSFTHSDLAPGTYYVSVDTYGSASRACAYTLTISFSNDSDYANQWVSLGTYTFESGQSVSNGSITIDESTVTGKLEGSQEGRVYADAIKVVPRITYRSGWCSDDYAHRVTGETICQVVVTVDSTDSDDSRDVSDHAEVGIYASPAAGATNSSAIVAKAVTGQRFVATEKNGNWYKIYLTNGTGATEGWIYGDNLFVYNDLATPTATPSPTPTVTPTPSPTPTPAVQWILTYSFDTSLNSWSYSTVTGFSLPTTGWSGGKVSLYSPDDGISRFGYWNSPPGGITHEADRIFRAKYAISTDQGTPDSVPTIRLRWITANLAANASHSIVSIGSQSYAPPNGSYEEYVSYFYPPVSSNMNIAFDMLDFAADESGTIYLDDVEVEKIGRSAFASGGTHVKTYDTMSDFNAWVWNATFGGFNAISSAGWGTGVLSMSSTKSADYNAGTFFSPSPSNDCTYTASNLYRATYSLSIGNEADRASMCGVRMRCQNEDNQMTQTMEITSAASGAAMPHTTVAEYELYWETPDLPSSPSTAEDGFFVGLDLLDFNSSEGGQINLDQIVIERFPAL